MLFLSEALALFLVVKTLKKTTLSKAFLTYILVDFCILCIDIYFHFIEYKYSTRFYAATNTLISVIELNVYYYYFNQILNLGKAKNSIFLISATYSSVAITYIIGQHFDLFTRFSYTAKLLGSIEFILIIPFCYLYYYNLLNIKSNLSIFERPSFWITTGIFTLTSVSIPFYLISSYFSATNNDNIKLFIDLFFKLPLIINFLFISKAFLCNKPLTT